MQRLQAAIAAAEAAENQGNQFSQQVLSERMRVSTRTVSRLWSLTEGLDQRTLKICFSTFKLDLHPDDFIWADDLDPKTLSDEAVGLDGHLLPLDGGQLPYPSGPVPLNSNLYVPRPPIEQQAFQEITHAGSILRLRAAKEMGKTSLMIRVLSHAKQLGYHTVQLEMNEVENSQLINLNAFLRWFASSVSQILGVEPRLDDYWDEDIGSKLSCSLYLERHILGHLKRPLVLALNEVNRIFEYPALAQEFLPMLRSWHERSQQSGNWQLLRTILVYSTEIYVPLELNQSPFNVGLPLRLPEFNLEQVRQLANRHGLDWETDNAAVRLMALVGGHPALIRIALYNLCRQEVTLAQLLEEASTDYGIYRSHLQRHLNTLREKPQLADAFAKIIQADHGIMLSASLGYQLESLGLVNLNAQGAVLSRELYRPYFKRYLLSSPEV